MFNNDSPLYIQITKKLRNDLESDKFKEGDLFHSDKELMNMFCVSSITVRRAVSELVNEGFLERHPGKGTFVKKCIIGELNQLRGFYDDVIAKGQKPTSHIILTKKIDITDELINLFSKIQKIDEKDVYHIEKVNYINDKPYSYYSSFWAPDIGEKVVKYDLCKVGIFEILTKEFNLSDLLAAQDIVADSANEKEAKHLDISIGTPLLVIERVFYVNGRVINCEYHRIRADKYKVSTVLKKDINLMYNIQEITKS